MCGEETGVACPQLALSRRLDQRLLRIAALTAATDESMQEGIGSVTWIDRKEILDRHDSFNSKTCHAEMSSRVVATGGPPCRRMRLPLVAPLLCPN